MGVRLIEGGSVDSLTDGHTVKEWGESLSNSSKSDPNLVFEIERWKAILSAPDSNITGEKLVGIKSRLAELEARLKKQQGGK